MGTYVYNNVATLYEGYNFTSDLNTCNLNLGVEPQDSTTFGDDTRIMLPGLMTASASINGFWDSNDADQPDDRLFPDIGTAGKLFTVFPEGLTDGNIGFSVPTARTQYNPGAAVGEMFSFSAEGQADARFIRPTILTTSTETATADGTDRQVGAVSATEQLYAILHVTATSGTTQTLDVVIRSAAASGMVGATTRITFTQVTTAVGAQYATPVDGAITDTWWDASWTITGTSPSFTFVTGIAIAANL